jgi:hypothetical protein
VPNLQWRYWYFNNSYSALCRTQQPRDLRRRYAAARQLRSWVRIPPREWMFVCCECHVLSGTGLCDELITHPEESYRLWCVVVCDLETSIMRRPWPALGRRATAKNYSALSWKMVSTKFKHTLGYAALYIQAVHKNHPRLKGQWFVYTWYTQVQTGKETKVFKRCV